jgi:small conductance mechanosensitive channel
METSQKIFWTAIIIVSSEVARHVIKSAISAGLSHISSARAQTLGSMLKNSSKFVVWTIGIMMALSVWNINVGPLIAGAGVLGLAVGFGAQSMVRDIISGLLLLADDLIDIGDKVEIAGKTGKVVSIKLRSLIIEDTKTKTIHIIPNSEVKVISKKK